MTIIDELGYSMFCARLVQQMLEDVHAHARARARTHTRAHARARKRERDRKHLLMIFCTGTAMIYFCNAGTLIVYQ
jgi:hypothetical protein